VAVDQIENEQIFEGPIHVSFKQVKNTAPAQKYKLLVGNFNFITSSEKGTPGVRVQLKFDPTAHKEHEKRSITDRFWFTPNAMNLYLAFLVACKINTELLREEPVSPPQFNPDGSPVTECVYSTEDQLKAIFGASVYANVTEESYEGVAADGVTPEIRWRNGVEMRGYSKV
jgi:hypothetical protein